ncbi:MAG: OpgC domain-containing protein [Chloroflexi bacterium]|nr:OpgC domain-containing protein [Chloroflexota bacterium]
MAQTNIQSPSTRKFPSLALPRSLALNWAYAANDKRDLRLDLLRGLAVFAMIVDHWGGPSWLYFITGGNTFFVSAAEGFFFISGLVVGSVYGGIALKQGLKIAQTKALARAGTLYKLTVVLTFLFATVSIVGRFGWANDFQFSDLPAFMFNVITLRQTMFLTDVPMIYTFLMLAAPIALGLLVKGHTKWLVLGSIGLWLAVQIFPDQIHIPWRVINSGTFDLAAWQVLFFSAMALGFHRDAVAAKLRQIPRVPYFVLASLLLIFLVRMYLNNAAWLASMVPGLDTQTFLTDFFHKTTLAPGRLIASLIVFQFAYLAVTLLWQPIRKIFGQLLLPLGQNSLYSYTMHVAVIAVLAFIIPKFPSETTSLDWVNTGVQLSGVIAIWWMIQRNFLFKIVPR